MATHCESCGRDGTQAAWDAGSPGGTRTGLGLELEPVQKAGVGRCRVHAAEEGTRRVVVDRHELFVVDVETDLSEEGEGRTASSGLREADAGPKPLHPGGSWLDAVGSDAERSGELRSSGPETDHELAIRSAAMRFQPWIRRPRQIRASLSRVASSISLSRWALRDRSLRSSVS